VLYSTPQTGIASMVALLVGRAVCSHYSGVIGRLAANEPLTNSFTMLPARSIPGIDESMPRRHDDPTLDGKIISLATDFGRAVAELVREHMRTEVFRVFGTQKNEPTVPRGRRGKRADGAVVQKKIADALAGAKKGLGLTELVEKIHLDRGVVGYHLRALRAKRIARVVGTRGQARWFA
jgi:hypothetical protein